MNDIVPLRGRPSNDDRAARIGMAVFIAGWTMMFGALLVAYLLLRRNAPAWPPLGAPALDRSLPSLATVVVIACSGALQLGLVAIREARPASLRGWLMLTLGLSISFVALQLGSWIRMMRRGLAPTSSIYAAGFFGLTAFHALHVLVGIVGLVTLVPRAWRGAFSARAHTALSGWTSYFHFVGIVWCVFFLAVFW